MIRIIPEQRRNLDRTAKQESQKQHHPRQKDIQPQWKDIVQHLQKWIEDHDFQDDDCVDIWIVHNDPPNG